MLAAALLAVALAAPPAPSPAARIHTGTPCLIVRSAATDSCYVPETNEIFIPANVLGTRFLIEHENGHAYDHLDVSPRWRASISKAMRWLRWRAEAFADFYAGCRMRTDPTNYYVRRSGIFGVFKGTRSVAARCRMIARAGA